MFTYDGSSAKTIDITPSKINAYQKMDNINIYGGYIEIHDGSIYTRINSGRIFGNYWSLGDFTDNKHIDYKYDNTTVARLSHERTSFEIAGKLSLRKAFNIQDTDILATLQMNESQAKTASFTLPSKSGTLALTSELDGKEDAYVLLPDGTNIDELLTPGKYKFIYEVDIDENNGDTSSMNYLNHLYYNDENGNPVDLGDDGHHCALREVYIEVVKKQSRFVGGASGYLCYDKDHNISAIGYPEGFYQFIDCKYDSPQSNKRYTRMYIPGGKSTYLSYMPTKSYYFKTYEELKDQVPYQWYERSYGGTFLTENYTLDTHQVRFWGSCNPMSPTDNTVGMQPQLYIYQQTIKAENILYLYREKKEQ